MSADYERAIESFQEAYNIDSTFTLAAFYIANANNLSATNSTDEKYTYQTVKWIDKVDNT